MKCYLFFSLFLAVAFFIETQSQTSYLYDLPQTKYNTRLTVIVSGSTVNEYYQFNNEKDIGYVSVNENTWRFWNTAYKFSLSSLPSEKPIKSVILKAEITQKEYDDPDWKAQIVLLGNNLNLSNAQTIYEAISGATLRYQFKYNDSPVTTDITNLINSQHIQDMYFILGARGNSSNGNSMAKLKLTVDVEYYSSYNLWAQNNFINGIIKAGVNNTPVQQTSPYNISPPPLINDVVNLEAQNQSYGGYERVWNSNGVPTSISKWSKMDSYGNIIDLPDAQNINYSFYFTLSDVNSYYIANLKKNYKIDVDHQTEFDGTQADQSITYIVEQNSGQISAPADTTINGRTYKFAGWTDGNGDNPRTINNPTDNKIYIALYKIPQRSNAGAYSNNSQRKIVRSDDGKLHMVYESMGYIWYERSTNGGTTWQIMNGGKPIDSNPGKAPSIEVLYQPENYQSEIYIVYQTYTSSTYDVAAIKVAYFLETQLQYINTVYVDDYYYRDYTSVNFNPVAAKMLAGRIMVAWEDYAIYYKIGNQISGGFTWGSTTSADNASGEKKFPTIASYRANPNGMFHLAWQNSYSTINYRSFTLQSNGTFIASSVENVSQGCGYPTNYAPSINVSSGNQVSLVWIGTPYYGSTTRKTISRTRTTAWSSSFGQYGDKVLSPNSAFYNGGNIIAWSENPSGSTYTNKLLKYGSVKTSGTTGKDIQVFNADNLNNMFISSFNSNAIPYYFSQSANLNSINKENGTAMASGVQAVAIGGKTDFYFRVGDVSVNGEAIGFIESEPQYGTLSLNQLNNTLLTNPFALDGNSNINFSVEYGVTDSVSALNQLSNNKFITFKIELIDYLTKEVLKEVGKFTLDKKRLITFLSNSYSYSISGLNGRQLSIRIKIVHNLNPLYASAVIKSDVAVLPKANLINLTSLASELVTTYGLEQNYPNPFNPTTKINWQAPISGRHILKVFDLLGNEIATLVDEWRDAGKYSHEFDASNLPSGVYVYQLRVNDFTASKKLLLLK